ncbi:penicillin-binding transpeptidase domain-containing protein [Marinobacteraceae bacterium S3BR75-40.1]
MGATRDQQPTTPLRRLLKSWRYGVVLSAAMVSVGALTWRLVDLHVVDHDFLRQQGDVRTVRSEPIEAHRGMITDRYGEPLAVSTPVQTIWANPSDIDPSDSRLSHLATLLNLDENELRQDLRKRQNRQFMFLKRKVQPNLAKQARALGIPGIYTRREYRRYYPAGEVTSHVVGFTNIDEQGQEGLELSYDDWLRGTPGRKRVLKDNRGHVIKDLSLIRDAEPGNDLQLTIDLRLQYLAYRELKAVVQAHKARSGTLVMLDVDTGEVLAMVNQPSYNPNDRSQLDPSALRNRAITDVFEPGSTVKPLTIAAALESGRYTPGTYVDTSPGYLRLNGYTIRDHRNYGSLDVTHIISKSSNVGASRIALDLTGPVVRDMFYRLGLGQATGIGFPGESIGVLPARMDWKKIEVATLSYGYGLSINALQLAQAYTVFANGGYLHPVSLVKQDNARGGQRVLDESVARQVRQMLKQVVKDGTGTRAALSIYQAGGKTGTVHLVGRSGYEDSDYKAIFAGMAPIDNPRIVCVVAVDDPKGDTYYGGEVAAPVFARVMSDALRLLNVEPDLDRKMADHDDKKQGGGDV